MFYKEIIAVFFLEPYKTKKYNQWTESIIYVKNYRA